MSERYTAEHEGLHEDDPFLLRWSERKSRARQGEPLPEPEEPSAAPPAAGDRDGEAVATAEEEPPRIDPRTGKPYDELTDEDMPPVESLDGESDVSMFMARNISPSLRRAALRRIFRAPKFNRIDLCAEYAGDYTTWEPLGDIVPHDMKRALAREAERARRKLEEEGAVAEADSGVPEDSTAAAEDAEPTSTATSGEGAVAEGSDGQEERPDPLGDGDQDETDTATGERGA